MNRNSFAPFNIKGAINISILIHYHKIQSQRLDPNILTCPVL